MLTDTDKAVLQFSGGKDSLACLYLLKPYWDRITVAWVNTGAAYMETINIMREVRAMVPKFMEINSDQPANIAKYGPPADCLPVRAMPQGKKITQYEGEPIQSFLECCSSNVWEPMAKACAGFNVIIRGQRLAEDRKSPIRSGHVENGVRYWFPIEDWSDEEVKSYLKEIGVPLPAHYSYTKTSLDCWSCTAYLDENQGRISHMRKEMPLLWAQYKPRLERIMRAAEAHVELMQATLGDS